MQRIIVTGGGGFIGRYLVKELLENGYKVFSVVRKKTGDFKEYLDNNRYFEIVKDLKYLSEDDFPDVEYSAFFHLGWHGVNREEINNINIHKTNYENAERCLIISKNLDCRCFLDAGSRAEYGTNQGVLKESLKCNPLTAYAGEKLRFYQYAYEFAERNKIEYVHFRLFSVIGKGDHPWSLISSACNKLKKGNCMEMGSCEQYWNFMDVRDAVFAMRQVGENIFSFPENDNRIVNIAGYDTRVLRSFIEEIRIITQSRSELVFDSSKKGENVIPDIRKLVTLTKWKAKYSFADTVREILEY